MHQQPSLEFTSAHYELIVPLKKSLVYCVLSTVLIYFTHYSLANCHSILYEYCHRNSPFGSSIGAANSAVLLEQIPAHLQAFGRQRIARALPQPNLSLRIVAHLFTTRTQYCTVHYYTFLSFFRMRFFFCSLIAHLITLLMIMRTGPLVAESAATTRLDAAAGALRRSTRSAVSVVLCARLHLRALPTPAAHLSVRDARHRSSTH